MAKSKKIMVVLGFAGLFLLSTGISWAAFSFVAKEKTQVGGDSLLSGLAKERERIAEEPKTEECPINGGMFSKTERAIWEGRRPLTVIIENHLDARPLSGVSMADVVYEAVAEGGITRFLGVFYCGAASSDFRVAVIRSARVYYIRWASEYGTNPVFLHWGGANTIDNNSPNGLKAKGQVAPEVDAFALLSKIGWRNGTYGNDMDGQSNTGVPVLKRLVNRLGPDKTAIAEHQPTAFIDEAYKEAERRGYGYEDSEGVAWDEDFVKWSFQDENALSTPKAEKIAFEFWSNKPEYDVEWTYNKADNSYLRSNGGSVFTDFEFENRQVSAKNVVIQFVKERGPVDKELHMDYENVGDGEALIFQNGDAIEATWEKESQFDRTIFYDENGDEIKFVRGQIWVEALPAGNDVIY